MQRKYQILAVLMAIALPLVAQDVKTDYDHNFDFSTIKTFAVEVGTAWGNPLSEERAKTAVTNALTNAGWTPADESSADALVVLNGATQTKHSLNTFYSGGWGGYGWRGGPGMTSGTTTVSEYQVGTLVVDIFDAKSKKLVYRGVGQDELSDKPEKNTQKIDKATQKMFKDFPPKPKKG